MSVKKKKDKPTCTPAVHTELLKYIGAKLMRAIDLIRKPLRNL